MAPPSPITAGRKNCPHCSCWRHLHDFAPLSKPRADGSPRFHSWCRYCQRIAARERLGCGASTNGLPGPDPRAHCGKGHFLGGDNLYIEPSTGRRVCRTCRAEMLASPDQKAKRRAYGRSEKRKEYMRRYRKTEHYREYNRFYREVRRREEGVPERERSRRAPVAIEEQVKGLAAEPFARWLRDDIGDTDLSAYARTHRVSDKLLRDVLNGKRARVSIDSVDQVLTIAGQQWLLEEMYPLEKVAA